MKNKGAFCVQLRICYKNSAHSKDECFISIILYIIGPFMALVQGVGVGIVVAWGEIKPVLILCAECAATIMYTQMKTFS